MSSTTFRHVLALLHDDEREACGILDRAVAIADAEHARLTLAKTSDPGRLVRWCGPLAALGRCAPMLPPDPRAIASRTLGQMTDRVPRSIPLGLLVLAPDTAGSMRKLLSQTRYDLVVVSRKALARDLRLGRLLRRNQVCVLALTAEASGPREPRSAPPESRLAPPESRLAPPAAVDRVAPV